MKIKFQSKSEKGITDPGQFGFYMDDHDTEVVEFLITRPLVKNLKIGETPSVKMEEEPISDGIVKMNKKQLKKLVAVLQLMVKS